MKKIKLFFLNEAFERVALMVSEGKEGLNFSSLEWKSIFHKQDTFALQCGVDPERQNEITPILNHAVYLIRGDNNQVGYIQKKEYDGSNLTLEGIGVEGLLAKRFTIEKDYIPPDGTIGQNKVGKVMCDIINDNSPFVWMVADPERNQTGVSIATYTELTGNVYKYVQMLSQAYDVGFRCVYNESVNLVYFQTFEVVSIDTEIAGRTYILSDDLDNIKEAEYEHDISKYYNVARIIGEDQTATVDQSGGGERYEYSFKSRSRRKALTVEEYGQILYSEGVQELAKRKIDESFVVTPVDSANLQLGWEASSASKKLNKTTVSFCTEITETWENVYRREFTMGYKADARDITIIGLQGEF